MEVAHVEAASGGSRCRKDGHHASGRRGQPARDSLCGGTDYQHIDISHGRDCVQNGTSGCCHLNASHSRAHAMAPVLSSPTHLRPRCAAISTSLRTRRANWRSRKPSGPNRFGITLTATLWHVGRWGEDETLLQPCAVCASPPCSQQWHGAANSGQRAQQATPPRHAPLPRLPVRGGVHGARGALANLFSKLVPARQEGRAAPGQPVENPACACALSTAAMRRYNPRQTLSHRMQQCSLFCKGPAVSKLGHGLHLQRGGAGSAAA